MARAKKAKISSTTPATAFDAHVTAYWKNKLEFLFPSPAEAVVFSETIERLEREDANALAADLAAALNVEPKVIRDKLRTLRNDLYRLNDPRNDGWNETQRAKAEAEAVELFAEKLEDLYAAALAKSRRSAVQKAATKRRVRKALIEVRKEHPGAKEHRIDELAASKANVGERTLQRYKPRR